MRIEIWRRDKGQWGKKGRGGRQRNMSWCRRNRKCRQHSWNSHLLIGWRDESHSLNGGIKEGANTKHRGMQDSIIVVISMSDRSVKYMQICPTIQCKAVQNVLCVITKRIHVVGRCITKRRKSGIHWGAPAGLQ